MPRLPFRRSGRTSQEPPDEEGKQPVQEERLTSATAEEEEFGSDEERSERTTSDSQDEEEMEPTHEEQLAAVVVNEEDFGSDGEDCELHVYESKYDTRGEKITLRAGTKYGVAPLKFRSHRACLVLTRQYRRYGAKVAWTSLDVQSRYVIRALRKVIGTYPGVDFTSNPISILEPPRCLFHYRDELRKHAEESEDEKEKSHIHPCLQYMEKTLHREIKILESSVLPGLEFDDLWMAFKPGYLVYEDVHDHEVSRLHSICEAEREYDKTAAWVLLVDNITYRGEKVGTARCVEKIKRYSGSKPICELPIYPLHLHNKKEKLRCDLLKRGRKYLSLWGIHHCFYDGIAWIGGDPREEKVSIKG